MTPSMTLSITRTTARTPKLAVVAKPSLSPDAPVESEMAHRDPAQWHQAIGVARQACARIFRDGGTAADAVRACAIAGSDAGRTDWSRAVVLIAESLCSQRVKRAA